MDNWGCLIVLLVLIIVLSIGVTAGNKKHAQEAATQAAATQEAAKKQREAPIPLDNLIITSVGGLRDQMSAWIEPSSMFISPNSDVYVFVSAKTYTDKQLNFIKITRDGDDYIIDMAGTKYKWSIGNVDTAPESHEIVKISKVNADIPVER